MPHSQSWIGLCEVARRSVTPKVAVRLLVAFRELGACTRVHLPCRVAGKANVACDGRSVHMTLSKRGRFATTDQRCRGSRPAMDEIPGPNTWSVGHGRRPATELARARGPAKGERGRTPGASAQPSHRDAALSSKVSRWTQARCLKGGKRPADTVLPWPKPIYVASREQPRMQPSRASSCASRSRLLARVARRLQTSAELPDSAASGSRRYSAAAARSRTPRGLSGGSGQTFNRLLRTCQRQRPPPDKSGPWFEGLA